jgi:hypothetical protein
MEIMKLLPRHFTPERATALYIETLRTTTIPQARGNAQGPGGNMCAGYLMFDVRNKMEGRSLPFTFPNFSETFTLNFYKIIVHLNDSANLSFEQIAKLLEDRSVRLDMSGEEVSALATRYPRKLVALSWMEVEVSTIIMNDVIQSVNKAITEELNDLFAPIDFGPTVAFVVAPKPVIVPLPVKNIGPVLYVKQKPLRVYAHEIMKSTYETEPIYDPHAVFKGELIHA